MRNLREIRTSKTLAVPAQFGSWRRERARFAFHELLQGFFTSAERLYCLRPPKACPSDSQLYFRGLRPEKARDEMKYFGFKNSWTLSGLRN